MERSSDHQTIAVTPIVPRHLAPAKVSEVYESYWRFAAERQAVFFRRARGEARPWTHNPVLSIYKFTNAYRASDRVSQYLIRRVIYRDDLPNSPREVFFRILLFKMFNKIETWELLERAFGQVTFEGYRFAAYDEVLARAMRLGQRIYSAAYIMPPGGRAFGRSFKHQNHLLLLERMMVDRLPDHLAQTRTMQEGFENSAPIRQSATSLPTSSLRTSITASSPISAKWISSCRGLALEMVCASASPIQVASTRPNSFGEWPTCRSRSSNASDSTSSGSGDGDSS